MKQIWNLQAKFGYYLKVEIAVCEAYSELGEIPTENLEQIKKGATFDLKRIDEIENEVHHDVIAFLTNVNEGLGENAKYMHKGLTSSDIIDTAF
ncbi:MAG: adenylosuccinate lyase, partial [Candidatus Gastranaerophilaceae bacterium]